MIRTLSLRCGLAAALPFLAPAVGAATDTPQLETTVAWDDNITRAAEAPGRLADRILGVTLSRGASVPLGQHTRVLATGFIAAEKLARYGQLDHLSAGVAGQLQYRASAAFSAPTFALFADVQRDEYRNAQRTGTRFDIGASARQSWTDRIDVSAALGWARRDARERTFDERQRFARAHVDYSAGLIGTLYAGAEWRRGDVVSTAPAFEQEYAHAARADAPDAAFGPGWHAYRFAGRTTIFTAGWSVPLGRDHSLDVAWRAARSSASLPADAVAAYGGETVHYRSNLYSVTYLLRF
jgi:hypothetical protein